MMKGSFVGFSESLDMLKLHTLLLGLAGVKPIVLEVARAGELDSYNGGNDERGVNYHFICVVGITPDGYVCNDGDNSAIEQHLVVYPWSEIEQAKPCGILVVEMENTVAQLTLDNTHGYFAAEKDYWRCKKTGATIWGSILDFYRDNDGLARLRLPTHSAKQPFPDDDNADKKGIWAQPFEAGALVFDPKRLLDNPPDQTGPVYYAHIDSGVIVSLFSPTPAPVPTPDPLTDQEKADLALANSLRIWLASK